MKKSFSWMALVFLSLSQSPALAGTVDGGGINFVYLSCYLPRHPANSYVVTITTGQVLVDKKKVRTRIAIVKQLASALNGRPIDIKTVPVSTESLTYIVGEGLLIRQLAPADAVTSSFAAEFTLDGVPHPGYQCRLPVKARP